MNRGNGFVLRSRIIAFTRIKLVLDLTRGFHHDFPNVRGFED